MVEYCPICGARFKTKRALRIHLATNHTDKQREQATRSDTKTKAQIMSPQSGSMFPQQTSFRISEGGLGEEIRKELPELEKWIMKGRDQRYAKDCLNALRKMVNLEITNPNELMDWLEGKSKYYKVGLRLFLRYLKEQKFELTLLGFPIEVWQARVKCPRSQEDEYYPSDEEVKQWLQLISNKWNDDDTVNTAMLLIASGLRLSHAYLCLKHLNKSEFITEHGVTRIPLKKIASKTKRVYFAYIPAKLAEILQPYQRTLDYSSLAKRLEPDRWKPPINIKMSAKYTRKWFINKAIDCGMDTDILKFITGHKSAGILVVHYLEKAKRAMKEYRKVLKPIERILGLN